MDQASLVSRYMASVWFCQEACEAFPVASVFNFQMFSMPVTSVSSELIFFMGTYFCIARQPVNECLLVKYD